MAKVEAPLFSFDASGRMGPITYVKGGIVRKHTNPANPQSDPQMLHRQQMSAAGAVVKIFSSEFVTDLRQNAGFLGNMASKHWVAAFVKAYLTASSLSTWDDLTVPTQTLWENTATNLGLTGAFLYAPEPISPGQQLQTACYALWLNGYENPINPATDLENIGIATWVSTISNIP